MCETCDWADKEANEEWDRESIKKDHAEAYRLGMLDAAKIAEDESRAYAGKALLASDACADVAKFIRARAKQLTDGSLGELK